MNNDIITINRKKTIWLVVGLTMLHIAASILYEPLMFGGAAQAALDSADFGVIATLVASKLIGCFLIWLFWHAIIRLFSGAYTNSAIISFFVLLLCSLIAIAILYPDQYAYEPDSLLIFREALAYDPAYWHHYLTGSFFAGCYMLLPHPVSLMLVQSALFSALIASVFSRLAARFGGAHAWPALLLLLVPASYYVQYSPYRNCLYTLLCMFACAEILFMWLDERTPSIGRQIRLALAFALIGIWRSEGILLFVLLPLGLWLAGGVALRRILWLSAAAAVVAAMLALPQSIGVAQTGQDGNYKIISTMNALQDIYNNEDVSLDYSGAEADMAIVEQFVPRAYLMEYGLAGYRAYNASNERGMNDSGQTAAQTKAFMGAYTRIVLHNLPAFVRAQGNRSLYALKLPQVLAKSVYSGPHIELPEPTKQSSAASQQKTTQDELTNGAFWRLKAGTPKANAEETLREQIGNWIYLYDAKTRRASIVIRLLLPVGALAIAVLFARLRKSGILFALLLAFAAELAAVVLMAPEGRTAYYYPVLFCGYLFVLILVPSYLAQRREKKIALSRGEAARLIE